MRRFLFVLVTVAVTASLAHGRVIIQVRSCGKLIDRGQAGILMADLDGGHQWGRCYECPGGRSCAAIEPAVSCSGRSDCPDPVTDKCDDAGESPASVGIYVAPGGRLYMNGYSIRHVQHAILGTYPDGVATSGRIRVIGPGTVASTREAIYITDGSLSGGLTLTDSLYGVAASKLRAKDVDASDNVIGLSVFNTMRATRVTADNNLYAGFVSYEGARITYSHATGNTVADVTSELPPRVTATVCDHSAALEETATPGIYSATGPPWGFCSGD